MIIPTITKGVLGTLGLVTIGVTSVAVIGGLYLIVDHEVKEYKRRRADVVKIEDE